MPKKKAKKGTKCSECKKRKATVRVTMVVDRFDVQWVNVCDLCAKDVEKHNLQFAN